MVEKIYKAGIIGCGFIGVEAPDSHLRAYMECDRTKVVGLSDNDWGKARSKFWDVRNLNWYLFYEEMIGGTHPDIVSICTPVETHCQIVCDIAPYVKAIYCEKPMATSLKECDRMIEVCEKNNVILQINHQRNFVPPVMRFSRDLIDTGTHAFALIRHLFASGIKVTIDYIPTDEHIFELDCTHNKEEMILAGVEHLVECLDYGMDSMSDGIEGREALRLALEFKEQYERTR